jgi:hypothetical protein
MRTLKSNLLQDKAQFLTALKVADIIQAVSRYRNIIQKFCVPAGCLVTNAYNPSYSGGRDQEDHSSKTAQANSLCDSISKITSKKKKGLAEWFKW